jgi:hypothetical protein
MTQGRPSGLTQFSWQNQAALGINVADGRPWCRLELHANPKPLACIGSRRLPMLHSLRNLIRGPFPSRQQRPRRQGARSRRAILTLECLENRAVPAILSVENSALFTFAATSPSDHVTISASGYTYTITNDEPISVYSPGVNVQGNGTPTVVFDATFLPGPTIQLDGGANTVHVLSNSLPMMVTDGSATGDFVILGSAGTFGTGNGTLAGIHAPVTAQSHSSNMTLVLDDSGDASAHNVTLSNGTITGLGPAPINFASGIGLVLCGGPGNDTFTVNNPGARATDLNPGTGSNRIWVEANSTPLAVTSRGYDYVWVSSSPMNNFTGTVANITGEVDVFNIGPSGQSGTGLTVCDQGDTNVFHTATLSNGFLTGLAPATIRAGTGVTDFNIYGGSYGTLGNSYVLDNPGSLFTHVYTGSIYDEVQIQAASDYVTVEGPGGHVFVESPNVSNLHGGTQYPDIIGSSGAFTLSIDDTNATAGQNVTLSSPFGGNLVTGLSPAPISFGAGVTELDIYGGYFDNQYTIDDVSGTSIATYLFCHPLDTVSVQATTGPLTTEGGHSVSLGTGTLTGLQGAVTVQPNGNSSPVLNVNDSSDTIPNFVTLQNGLISGFASVTINYTGVSQVNVYGGSGSNAYDIEDPAAPLTDISTGSALGQVKVGSTTNPVIINGDGASLAFNLGTGTLTAIQGGVTIENTGSNTFLLINNGNDTTAHANVNLDYGSLTGLAPAAITWGPTALSQLDVFDGTGLESYTIDNPGLFPTYIYTNNANDRATLVSNTGLIEFNGQVLANAVTQLAVTGPAGPITTGVPFQVTVTARDANGNVLKTYAGTIQFWAVDQQAALPEAYTFTAADRGSHTFTMTLTQVGSDQFGVYEADETNTYSVQGGASVTVNPSFMLGKPAGPVTAGVPFQVTVTAQDANGNVITDYTGTVSFSSSDQKASLPASYTFTAGDQGSHSFAVTLASAGSQTITATDSSGTISAQATVTVALGAAGLTTSVTAPATAAAKFTVSWAGTDANAGAAISGYSVYISDNGGPFTAWLSNTTVTSATYAGQLGHTYGFYAVATDTAGYQQATPASAQATTQVTISGPTASISSVSSPTSSAVSSLTITFNEPVFGLTLSNLRLTQGGSSANLLTAAQTLTTTDHITWTLGNLAGLTDPTHRVARFTLTLAAANSGVADLAGNPLQTSAATSFTVVAPSLTLQGQTLTVPGTSGNDTFTFTAGPAEQATVNGVPVAIDPTVVSTVQFQGNGGSDVAILNAAGTGNTATLSLGAGTLQGSGYTVSVRGITTLVVQGASSSDSATLGDSSGSNIFVSTPTYAYLKGGNVISEVIGFPKTVASSTSNSDSAYLYSASGANTFVATPTYAYYVTGAILNEVVGFKAAVAIAAAGTNDSAFLYGAPSNGNFIATPAYGYYVTGGILNEAVGFKAVQALAQGGHDTATLYDGSGSNTLVATPAYAYLKGTGYFNEVVGFTGVVANAAAGSSDSAFLYDASGSNTFAGTPTYSYLTGSGYFNEAMGFRAVSVFSAKGTTDVAYLYDSPGGDTFTGQGKAATISGASYGIALDSFAQVVAVGAAGATNHLHLATINYLFSALGKWTPS